MKCKEADISSCTMIALVKEISPAKAKIFHPPTDIAEVCVPKRRHTVREVVKDQKKDPPETNKEN